MSVQPKLIIHGGAGSSLKGKGGLTTIRESLYKIVAEVYRFLDQGGSAVDAVILGAKLLEDDPKLESDRGRAARQLLWLMSQEEAIRLISVG